MNELRNIITTPLNETNNTLEKILENWQKTNISQDHKQKAIKDIDKAYNFTHKETSKTKDRHSTQKSHLKTQPSHLVSTFSIKGSNMKKKKNNHKSLSS